MYRSRHLLKEYLDKLNSNNMDTFLSGFKKVIVFKDPEDIKIGLLKYKDRPEKGVAFLFKMPKEEILHFHTIGMKFPISISFWNSKKENVYTNGISKPGIKDISSQVPAKYVIEVPE